MNQFDWLEALMKKQAELPIICNRKWTESVWQRTEFTVAVPCRTGGDFAGKV